jgi:hypothetical protein
VSGVKFELGVAEPRQRLRAMRTPRWAHHAGGDDVVDLRLSQLRAMRNFAEMLTRHVDTSAILWMAAWRTARAEKVRCLRRKQDQRFWCSKRQGIAG